MTLRRGLQRRVAEVLADGATALGTLSVAGTLAAAAALTVGTGVTLAAGQYLGPDGAAAAPTFSFNGATNTGLLRDASANPAIARAATTGFNVNATGTFLNGTATVSSGNILFTERADPAAPAANQCALYAKDSGAGKTQLAARFNSGAVQVPAVEP